MTSTKQSRREKNKKNKSKTDINDLAQHGYNNRYVRYNNRFPDSLKWLRGNAAEIRHTALTNPQASSWKNGRIIEIICILQNKFDFNCAKCRVFLCQFCGKISVLLKMWIHSHTYSIFSSLHPNSVATAHLRHVNSTRTSKHIPDEWNISFWLNPILFIFYSDLYIYIFQTNTISVKKCIIVSTIVDCNFIFCLRITTFIWFNIERSSSCYIVNFMCNDKTGNQFYAICVCLCHVAN